MFCRMIISKKSRNFWDHALTNPSLTRLAPQERRDLKLVLFESPRLIGAPAMRIDRRLRNSLRRRRMLRPFGIFGVHRVWLRRPVGLRRRGLPHGRLPISWRGASPLLPGGSCQMMQAAQAASGAWTSGCGSAANSPRCARIWFCAGRGKSSICGILCGRTTGESGAAGTNGPASKCSPGRAVVARVRHNDAIAAQLPGYEPCCRSQHLAQGWSDARMSIKFRRLHSFPVAAF